MEKSESIANLAAALSNFQGSVANIKKTTENSLFNVNGKVSKYATLDDIIDVIRKPMCDNGLAFSQLVNGDFNLETILMHSSGEFISHNYCMPPNMEYNEYIDGKKVLKMRVRDTPHGRGSVITYARRYSLASILGLCIDDDDDGNAASVGESLPPVASKQKEPAQPETKKKKWDFKLMTDEFLGKMLGYSEKYSNFDTYTFLSKYYDVTKSDAELVHNSLVDWASKQKSNATK